MAGMRVSTKHSLDFEEAKSRAKDLAERFRAKLPIKSVTWSPDGTSGMADGKGFSAHFEVSETEVAVTVEFGIFLRPLAGQLQGQIQRSLDRAFA